MNRRGFTLIELMIATGIGVFVLAALSLVYFMTLNYYRSVLAETLQPTTARALRDRLCFRLADDAGNPTGLGLLSYGAAQVASYQLGEKGVNARPTELSFVHLPPELSFDTRWDNLTEMAKHAAVTNTLAFSPRGVLHGGTTNRCELLFYVTPFGASQPMATTDGKADPYDADRTMTRPGAKGAVL